jgi:hypothetical protein
MWGFSEVIAGTNHGKLIVDMSSAHIFLLDSLIQQMEATVNQKYPSSIFISVSFLVVPSSNDRRGTQIDKEILSLTRKNGKEVQSL